MTRKKAGREQRFTWVWLKIKQEGLRRFWSMFALTRAPFWYRFFEPQPRGVQEALQKDDVVN